jgi:lipoprotein-releasing system permease protein
MRGAGWQHRRWWAQREKAFERPREEQAEDAPNTAGNPFAARSKDGAADDQKEFDPETQQNTGIVLGMALASYRDKDGGDRFLALPGDDVKVTLPTSGTPPKAVSDTFTIVDFYESKMSEYDSSFVFVPIEKLQELRGMVDPSTGVGNITSIQIKLKNPADGDEVRNKLRAIFPPQVYGVATWRDKQGPLLSAVAMETAILNVLLFLIIAVAGFGILAIFFMIVVEKTKDIGILKSLGAPARGVMGIFLAYGISLGVVGAGAGVIAGVLFVIYINEIAELVGWITGTPVFSPDIYYFQQIPTIIEPFTVAWVALGAVLIAIAASALPARRAARLHPVEALRYE